MLRTLVQWAPNPSSTTPSLSTTDRPTDLTVTGRSDYTITATDEPEGARDVVCPP